MSEKCMNCGQGVGECSNPVTKSHELVDKMLALLVEYVENVRPSVWRDESRRLSDLNQGLLRRNKDLVNEVEALRCLNLPDGQDQCSSPPAKPELQLDMDFLAAVGMSDWVKSGIHPSLEYDFLPFSDLMQVTCRRMVKNEIREQFFYSVRVTKVAEFREFCRFLGVEVPEPHLSPEGRPIRAPKG